MISVPSYAAYLSFAVLCFLAWAGILVFWSGANWKAQLWMTGWGMVGGPLINWAYQTDFWQPIQTYTWLPLESMLFGGSFLGIVTVFTLMLASAILVPQSRQTVSRYVKVGILAGTVATMLLVYYFGGNSIATTIVGCTAGAMVIGYSRPDLIRLIWRGALVSVVALAVLVGGFLFGVADNADALGRELSSFYARHGALGTGFVLFLWAVAFGAFFGPFYPWAKNLEFAPLPVSDDGGWRHSHDSLGGE